MLLHPSGPIGCIDPHSQSVFRRQIRIGLVADDQGDVQMIDGHYVPLSQGVQRFRSDGPHDVVTYG